MNIHDLKKRIEDAVPNSTAHVFDPMEDGQHLHAIVISPAFEGMATIKQQQMVMYAIKDVFDTLHALGLKTFTPERWETERLKYNM